MTKLSKKIVKDKYGYTHPSHIDYCEMCGKKTRLKKFDARTTNLCKKCLEGQKYNFEKSVSKESKHMTKIRKKYKNHKFTKDEVIGYE
jgi:ribosome-binding protein aMBF1 (putative translation factor)